MKERRINDVTVIELPGSFLGDPEVSAFHEHIRLLGSDGEAEIVADLGKVHLISSSGVGALVRGAATLRSTGGDLKLANLSERTHNVLVVITRLGSVFNIYDSAEDAAASY